MTFKSWKNRAYALDIRYKLGNGERARLRLVLPTNDEQEAKSIHDAICNYLHAGGPKPTVRLNWQIIDWDPGYRPMNAHVHSIADLAFDYLEFVPNDVSRNLQKSTQKSERYRIKRIVERIGHIPISEVNEAATGFVIWTRDNLATQTQVHYHVTLRNLFKHGIRLGVLNSNPMQDVAKPKIYRDPIYPLSRQELEIFLEIVDGINRYWRYFFQFAVGSGLRLGELRALKNIDIGEVPPAIHVSRSVDDDGNITPTKGKKNRFVPLMNPATEALSEIRSGTHDDWLFRRKDGSQILGSSFRKTFKKAVDKLARPRPMTFHTFRHTYATLALSSGVKVARVSKWLGHASVTTTERVYDGMTAMSDGVDDDIKKFESFWDNDGPKKGDFGSTVILRTAKNRP